jgi:hypothetical protein
MLDQVCDSGEEPAHLVLVLDDGRFRIASSKILDRSRMRAPVQELDHHQPSLRRCGCERYETACSKVIANYRDHGRLHTFRLFVEAKT